MTKPREMYVVIRRNPPSVGETHHRDWGTLAKQKMPVGIYIPMSRNDEFEKGTWEEGTPTTLGHQCGEV